jgi:calcium-dependent protein kinase
MFTSNDADGDLKLLDFGFSRTYLQGENIKYVAGTPYTMSPEVFKRKAGPPSDVWAVAVCMYVLLYGRRPFEGTDRYQIEEKVMNGAFEWREDIKGYLVSDVVKDLITKCLVLDPDKRLTTDEALRHPFFTDPIDINATTSATGTDTANTDANNPKDGPHKIKMLTRPKASVEEVNDVIDHLWAFSELGKLRKVVLLAVSQSLTAKEIAGLNVVFEELDLTKDGTIGFVELTHAVQKYSAKNNKNVNIPKDSLQKLFDDLDQDNSGFIKYSEFIAACLEQNETYSDGVLADAFSRMDLDNSGFITRKNLTELMRSASDDLSDEQLTETVDRMLSEGDINHDGQISLEELKQVMRSPATRQGKYGRDISNSSVESVTYEDIANRREKDAGLIASLVEVIVEEKNE